MVDARHMMVMNGHVTMRGQRSCVTHDRRCLDPGFVPL